MKKNFKKKYIIIPIISVLIISSIIIGLKNEKNNDVTETLALNVNETKINSTDNSKELEEFASTIPMMPEETVVEAETNENVESISGDEILAQNGVPNPEYDVENMERGIPIQFTDKVLSTMASDMKTSDLIALQQAQATQEIQEETVLETLSPEQIENAREAEPETTAPEIDYKGMVWNNSKEERQLIYQKGIELLELSKETGHNTSGMSTVFQIGDSQADFSANGSEKYISISKDYLNNSYDVDIYVTVNPEKSKLNNEALKQLCKLISYNNDNVYNAIMNDYMNESLKENEWTSSNYNFKIKFTGDKENKLTRYSIKY